MMLRDRQLAKSATCNAGERLEKLDRESLVSNPLSVQKVDYGCYSIIPGDEWKR